MNFQTLFLLGMVLVMAAASSSLTACDRRNGAPPPISSATAEPASDDKPALDNAVRVAPRAMADATPAAVTVYVKPPYGASAPVAAGSDGIATNKPVVHGGVDQAPIVVPPSGTASPTAPSATVGAASPDALLAGAPPAAGQRGVAGTPLTASEHAFVATALDAALAELRLSQVAADRASNSVVKSYAALLIADQGNLVQGLQLLAQQKGVATSDALTEPRLRQLESLARSGQDAFDQAFLKVAGSGENQALIALFEKADRESRDPAVKALVQSVLPSLKAHLSASEQLPVKG